MLKLPQVPVAEVVESETSVQARESRDEGMRQLTIPDNADDQRLKRRKKKRKTKSVPWVAIFGGLLLFGAVLAGVVTVILFKTGRPEKPVIVAAGKNESERLSRPEMQPVVAGSKTSDQSTLPLSGLSPEAVVNGLGLPGSKQPPPPPDSTSRPHVARKKMTPPSGWQVLQDPQNEFSCWLPSGEIKTDQAQNKMVLSGERVDMRTFLTDPLVRLYIASVYAFYGANPDTLAKQSDLERDCDDYLKAFRSLHDNEVTNVTRTPTQVGGVDGLKVVVRYSRGPSEIIYFARSAGRLFRFHQSIPKRSNADGPDVATFADGIEILIR